MPSSQPVSKQTSVPLLLLFPCIFSLCFCFCVHCILRMEIDMYRAVLVVFGSRSSISLKKRLLWVKAWAWAWCRCCLFIRTLEIIQSPCILHFFRSTKCFYALYSCEVKKHYYFARCFVPHRSFLFKRIERMCIMNKWNIRLSSLWKWAELYARTLP